MSAKELSQTVKKAYVKPELTTHGSVQQLTEGGSHYTPPVDSGSNIKVPTGPITFKGW